MPTPAGPKLTRPSRIDKSHDTTKFYCGHPALDDWLKNNALKSEGRTSRTYVVCEGRQVVGYYCLATGSIARSDLPSKATPHGTPNPVPIMIIGRLATAKHCERQGIGGGMLKDAILRVVQAAESVGCRAIIVHAIDDEAVGFYARYGFKEFPAGTRTMFLAMETARVSAIG